MGHPRVWDSAARRRHIASRKSQPQCLKPRCSAVQVARLKSCPSRGESPIGMGLWSPTLAQRARKDGAPSDLGLGGSSAAYCIPEKPTAVAEATLFSGSGGTSALPGRKPYGMVSCSHPCAKGAQGWGTLGFLWSILGSPSGRSRLQFTGLLLGGWVGLCRLCWGRALAERGVGLLAAPWPDWIDFRCRLRGPL